MTNDEDNKENIQNKKDDAQVKNSLNDIKAQVTATNNPAELARLANAAANLASNTNNPAILDQIKNLQYAISRKEENAEQVIYSGIASENLQTPQQNAEAIREQELHKRHEGLKASHNKFMQDADELIEKKKQHNQNLQGILEDLKNGKEIDPERLKSAVKTEEQIQEEREKEQTLKERQQQYNQHYQELKAEEEKLKKQRVELGKEAEAQHKTNEKLTSNALEQGQYKLTDINNKIQQIDVKLEAIRPKVEEATKMKDDFDKEFEDLEKIKNETIKNQKELQEEIKKQKEKNPEKYNSAFDDFSTLLLNQIKAAESGEIKDHELRNKFLSKEERKEPEIKFPGQKSVPEKLSQGEEALKLAEHRPVSKDKVQKYANNVQVSLEKQKALVNSNKETQLNNLARSNQQNKKNEGHSR